MSKKKVVIGCQDFTVCKQVGNGYDTAGEVLEVPGLQEIELEIESEQGKVFADNETALVLNSGVTGATVTGNFIELDSKERAELIGVEVDENGMELYKKDLIPPYVSASWKYRCNDGSYIYFGVTRGNFGLPGSSAETMEDGAPEQQDQVELEGTFIPRDDGLVFVRVHNKATGFTEDAFYTLIHGKTLGGSTETPVTP